MLFPYFITILISSLILIHIANSHLFELGRVLLGWRKKKDKSKRSPTKKTGASKGLEVRDDGSCDPLLDDGEDVVDNEDDADDEAEEESDGQKGIIHT